MDGERIKDHMRGIVPMLLDQSVSNFDKMRLIILYVISKNGLSEENLNKVVQHAQLLPEEKQAIMNLSHLGLNSVVNVSYFFISISSQNSTNSIFNPLKQKARRIIWEIKQFFTPWEISSFFFFIF